MIGFYSKYNTELEWINIPKKTSLYAGESTKVLMTWNFVTDL